MCVPVCYRCGRTFLSWVACPSHSVADEIINVLSCYSRSRPACDWNAERLRSAFSAHSGPSSGAHKIVAYHFPNRTLSFSALLASDRLGRLHLGRRRSSSYDSTPSGVKKVSFLHCFSKHRNVPPNCASSPPISAPPVLGLTVMSFANSARQMIFRGRLSRLSCETEMTRQLSIITSCSAGPTESFVVVPELVKIKYVHPFLFSALSDPVTTKLFVGCKPRP